MIRGGHKGATISTGGAGLYVQHPSTVPDSVRCTFKSLFTVSLIALDIVYIPWKGLFHNKLAYLLIVFLESEKLTGQGHFRGPSDSGWGQ